MIRTTATALAVLLAATACGDAKEGLTAEGELEPAVRPTDLLREHAEREGGSDVRVFSGVSRGGVEYAEVWDGHAVAGWSLDGEVCIGVTRVTDSEERTESSCVAAPGATTDAVPLDLAVGGARAWQIPDDALSVEVVTPDGATYMDPADIAGARILAVGPDVTVTEVHVSRLD